MRIPSSLDKFTPNFCPFLKPHHLHRCNTLSRITLNHHREKTTQERKKESWNSKEVWGVRLNIGVIIDPVRVSEWGETKRCNHYKVMRHPTHNVSRPNVSFLGKSLPFLKRHLYDTFHTLDAIQTLAIMTFQGLPKQHINMSPVGSAENLERGWINSCKIFTNSFFN